MSRVIRHDGETGEIIADFEVPEPVPASVSARQMKLALLGAALLDDIEAFVATQERAVQISWEYATELHRTDPMLVGAAAAFGMTDEQMDDLFRQAAGL